MKYSFKMNAEDYYIGYKYKVKKRSPRNNYDHFALKLILSAIVIFILTYLLKMGTYSFLYTAIFVVFVTIMQSLKKKAFINQFYSSPVKTGKHTLCLYDEGLEIINAYEKIFVPWQSIYAIKNDSRMLTILPTYRKGIFTIRKTQENREELEQIINVLQNHIKIEEGK